MQYVPLKYQETQIQQHSIMSQNNWTLSNTNVEPSYLAKYSLFKNKVLTTDENI